MPGPRGARSSGAGAGEGRGRGGGVPRVGLRGCLGSPPCKDLTTPTFFARAQPALHSTFRGGAPSEGGGGRAGAGVSASPLSSLPPGSGRRLFLLLQKTSLFAASSARSLRRGRLGSGCSGLGRAASALIVCHRTCPRAQARGGPAPRPAWRPPVGWAGVQVGRGRGELREPSSMHFLVQAGGLGRGGWAQPGPRVSPARGSPRPAGLGRDRAARRAAGAPGGGGAGRRPEAARR